jgi:hypothetical protein
VLLEIEAAEGLARSEDLVEVVDLGNVEFAVVNLHGLRVEFRFERLGGVRKRREVGGIGRRGLGEGSGANGDQDRDGAKNVADDGLAMGDGILDGAPLRA